MADTIEGKNPVLEALKAGRPVNRILLAKGLKKDAVVNEILMLARNSRIPFEYAEKSTLERLGTAGRGIIAITASHDYVDIFDLLEEPGKLGEPKDRTTF